MKLVVTGHRLNKLGYGRFDQFLCDTLAEVYLKFLNPEVVYTGVALGWDTNIARACISLGIPFIAAVPFAGQECRWPDQAQAEYRRICDAAEKVVVVCAGSYSPFKMQARNEYMVDRADKVLALFNKTTGGTFNCVRYAKKTGKEVINAWREYEIFH
ncbi:SLOG family protein [Morganella psychrotolerans]|uniref:SLOG family protein n=1 Tax=Morganella psychrotolerans TaxID=368603 RepID=UPI000800CA24|nr:SLOG family protein [Morganella psychrotolerans]OBU01919.1 hypothetical protein AYY16_17070 [Morganella psychrotolerans]